MSQQHKNFTFTWIINNYSFYDISNGVSIFSPTFTAENIDKNEWRIVVLQISDGSDEYISLQLNRLWVERIQVNAAEKEKIVTLDFEIELCNAENEVFYITEKKEGVNSEIGAQYPFPKVLLKKDLEKKIEDTSTDILILRCRMSTKFDNEITGIPSNLAYTIKTTKCTDELSYMREVFYSKDPRWANQLTFTIYKTKQLNVNIEAPEDDILVKITQDDEKSGFSRKIKCEITLLDEERTETISCCDFFTFSEKFKIWHFPSFLKRSLLKNEIRTLYLKFNFTFANGLILREQVDETKRQCLPYSSEVSENVPAISSLTRDLHKMLFSKELSDVSFCVDGEVISAHKFILASRSAVFSTMFHQKMVENETGVIDISDMDLQTLKLFLEFLYTEGLPETDWERKLELLLAAEKYHVPSLKGKCFELLKHLLSPDNVCDVASVADMVGGQTLKDAAIDYIRKNVAQVLNSSKWSMFFQKNVQLCSEIFKILSEDLKSKHVANV